MRASLHLPSAATLRAAAAALLALVLLALVAWWGALAIETRTVAAIKSRLLGDGITWATVSADGLHIRLDGTAPNEAARFRAVNLAGGVVDAGRIDDRLEVTALRAIEPPRFSVEVLRNDDGVSLIGLVPAGAEGAEVTLSADVAAIAGDVPVADMLETAEYPAPDGWQAALDFGMEALRRLPRSKISVSADQVAITAISDSVDEKRRLEAELARLAPPGLDVALDISAPRPVLTPFTLRFVKDAGGARFDACAADTDRARARILAAGAAAGVQGKVACTVGLGVPSPRWADAAEAAIRAVGSLGAATVTFSDADVTLMAAPEVEQAVFDRVVGDLQATLPKVFSLTATLQPRPEQTVQGPAEFTAVLNAEGRVELRGRLTDELQRTAVDSFARAFFGTDSVYTATRLGDDLPDGWPVRVLAGLEALSFVEEGSLLVRADMVEVKGVTGNPDARARISQILSDKLGPGQTFRVDVRYDEERDPQKALPTPEECAADLNAVVAAQKITFAPGSAEIDGTARGVIDALADVLKDCPGLRIEIAGHTDAQGSEGGNLALSQARAEAVLVALQGRRLDVAGFRARGYGEAVPLADNATDEGREANRRIEFTLLGADGAPVAAPVADAAPEDGAPADGAPAAEGAPAVEGAEAGAGVAWAPLSDPVAGRPRARPEAALPPADPDAAPAPADTGAADPAPEAPAAPATAQTAEGGGRDPETGADGADPSVAPAVAGDAAPAAVPDNLAAAGPTVADGPAVPAPPQAAGTAPAETPAETPAEKPPEALAEAPTGAATPSPRIVADAQAAAAAAAPPALSFLPQPDPAGLPPPVDPALDLAAVQDDLGPTRAITVPAQTDAAAPDHVVIMFVPTDETTIRPPRRPDP